MQAVVLRIPHGPGDLRILHISGGYVLFPQLVGGLAVISLDTVEIEEEISLADRVDRPEGIFIGVVHPVPGIDQALLGENRLFPEVVGGQSPVALVTFVSPGRDSRVLIPDEPIPVLADVRDQAVLPVTAILTVTAVFPVFPVPAVLAIVAFRPDQECEEVMDSVPARIPFPSVT